MIRTIFFILLTILCTINIAYGTAISKVTWYQLVNNNQLYGNINLGLKEAINKIINTQDSFFTIKSKPYSIFLINSPNELQVRGEAKTDYIIITGNLNKDNNDTIRVIAHELIHRYIGHILLQNTNYELEYKWFFEGFTEYLGVQSLLNSKLIDNLKYSNIINDSLEKYFSSPINNIQFSKIRLHHMQDKHLSTLAYYKGFIIAFMLDNKIKEESHNLYDIQSFLNEIISASSLDDYSFKINTFKKALNIYLPYNFKTFFTSINDMKLLKKLLPKTIPNMHLASRDVYQPLVCFNLSNTIESMTVRGVHYNSKCYSQGLRDGQILKGYNINYDAGSIQLYVFNDAKQEKKIINIDVPKQKLLVPSYSLN